MILDAEEDETGGRGVGHPDRLVVQVRQGDGGPVGSVCEIAGLDDGGQKREEGTPDRWHALVSGVAAILPTVVGPLAQLEDAAAHTPGRVALTSCRRALVVASRGRHDRLAPDREPPAA